MIEAIKNIYYFIQGNLRYKIFYSNFVNILPEHILEQIEYRLAVMDKDCYELGQCKLCGCSTTALQMANKSCDKPCYPIMKSKKEWHLHKKEKGLL